MLNKASQAGNLLLHSLHSLSVETSENSPFSTKTSWMLQLPQVFAQNEQGRVKTNLYNHLTLQYFGSFSQSGRCQEVFLYIQITNVLSRSQTGLNVSSRHWFHSGNWPGVKCETDLSKRVSSEKGKKGGYFFVSLQDGKRLLSFICRKDARAAEDTWGCGSNSAPNRQQST